MKKTLLLLLLLLGPSLSACGYDGNFRYACQDPENWGTEDCIPPKCRVTGTCTSDLLGFEVEP
jgi:hypothetical protein